MGAKICVPECVILPRDMACQFSHADCIRRVPSEVRRLPQELSCTAGHNCQYAPCYEIRNPDVVFPDLNKNIFTGSAAWEEGFGEVYVTKHHVDDEGWLGVRPYLKASVRAFF
eukprot:GEMP01090607.1.p2 GENE.GEMP01090607.1~~GEMP01090607.1.p2  ORF type:complete len:113 (+),score=20.27 GEMP01090607.1:113-451(+)